MRRNLLTLLALMSLRLRDCSKDINKLSGKNLVASFDEASEHVRIAGRRDEQKMQIPVLAVQGTQ
jgi:hypothetical protein